MGQNLCIWKKRNNTKEENEEITIFKWILWKTDIYFPDFKYMWSRLLRKLDTSWLIKLKGF